MAACLLDLEPAAILDIRQANNVVIRIQTGENGEPTTSVQAADPEYFAAQVSMESDRLSVPAAYVETIKGAQPIGYWRFERDEWPSVPNVMGPKLSCHVNGVLGRATHQSNQAARCPGMAEEDGCRTEDQRPR